MVYVFYVLAAFFVYFELYAIVNAREIITESKYAQKVIEDVKRTGHGDGRDIDPNYMRAYMIDFFYMVWSALGLLSSQWVFFVCLFLLTLVTSLMRSRILSEASISDNVRFDRANSVVSIGLLVLLVGNKFFEWFDVPRSILQVLGVW